jgi:hypothetical protein
MFPSWSTSTQFLTWFRITLATVPPQKILCDLLNPPKPFHYGVDGSLSRGYEWFFSEFYEDENDPSAGVVAKMRFGVSTFPDRWLVPLGGRGVNATHR